LSPAASPSSCPTLLPPWPILHTTAYSRLKSRSLPFMDEYPPNNFTKASPVFKTWETDVSRAISGDPSRWPVYHSWTPHGFGSNLLSNVNYIVYATLHNASITLVSKGSPYNPPRQQIAQNRIAFDMNDTRYEKLNEGLMKWWMRHQAKQATLQAWFEESFAYGELCETMSDRYDDLCWGKRICDFPPFGKDTFLAL